ncbi:MAG: Gfo/Idh/MocA family oxidoreductase, partial [SAR324 cluster bacterium]|nr:Gfo/Idh/MocA family oxidoreductase [SAR324 cluster bacterium]
MNAKLGVGVIGCGNISSAYFRLAPLFRNIEIKACADLKAETAQNQAAEFGILAMDVDSLLANRDVEIIVNLTVPDAHFMVSKSIIESGKHVFSEKPLTLSLDEAIKLKVMAETRGVKLACAPDTFLGGVHQQARNLIDSDSIGNVTGGTCHVMSHGMEHWHPNPDFFYKPGGGPIMDLGPYYIGNLIQLIGPVNRVTALATIPQQTRTSSSEERF